MADKIAEALSFFNVADLEHEDFCDPFQCQCGKWKYGTRLLYEALKDLKASLREPCDEAVLAFCRKANPNYDTESVFTQKAWFTRAREGLKPFCRVILGESKEEEQ